MSLDGAPVAQMAGISTFSEYSTVDMNSCVKVPEDVPLDKICLLGCGVGTGWGSAVNSADVQVGDTVIVMGIGGIGINAVQGAAFAGAQHVIAVDPLANKRDTALKLGATHSATTAAEAHDLAIELTRGVGADEALVTVDLVTEKIIEDAFKVIRKAGTVVVTGLAAPDKRTIHLPSAELTLYQKRIQGSLLGAGNPFNEIPRLLGLYQSGHLKLDELITTRYRLDEVGQGYEDLLNGKLIRGVIVHD
jgi:S-(hydroxymethyl)glutathione dehydrogenase/alcohol dehydrogenase